MKRRLAGLFVFAGGLLLIWLAWRSAVRNGSFLVHASFGGPAFASIGLGLGLFPGYREERRARGEDITRLSGLALLTPRWWAVLVLGMAAGALYTAALYFRWIG